MYLRYRNHKKRLWKIKKGACLGNSEAEFPNIKAQVWNNKLKGFDWRYRKNISEGKGIFSISQKIVWSIRSIKKTSR